MKQWHSLFAVSLLLLPIVFLTGCTLFSDDGKRLSGVQWQRSDKSEIIWFSVERSGSVILADGGGYIFEWALDSDRRNKIVLTRPDIGSTQLVSYWFVDEDQVLILEFDNTTAWAYNKIATIQP